MSRRNKVIILALIALAIIVLLVFIAWLFLRPKPAVVPPVDPSAINVPTVLPQASASQTDTPADVTAENLNVSLKALATSFAERFGSYSNQNNFNNLEDLRGMMTLRMDAWTDNYIANQPANTTDSYSGVTTIAVASKIVELNEALGQATILISTQRQEAKGTTANPRVSYQDIEIELVKTEQGWRVDAIAWQ